MIDSTTKRIFCKFCGVTFDEDDEPMEESHEHSCCRCRIRQNGENCKQGKGYCYKCAKY